MIEGFIHKLGRLGGMGKSKDDDWAINKANVIWAMKKE